MIQIDRALIQPPAHHICIGAKLKILLQPLSRSSLPTTPFNLVPIGSPPLCIKTQALSSNRILLPSGLDLSLVHRTTTACRMSPLRTFCAAAMETEPPGPDSGPNDLCFWTTTTIRSPDVGVLGWYVWGKWGRRRTYPCRSLAFQDLNAFDDGGTGVVDTVEHRLW